MALTSFPFPRWFRPDAEKCTNSSAMAGNSIHEPRLHCSCKSIDHRIIDLRIFYFCVLLAAVIEIDRNEILA